MKCHINNYYKYIIEDMIGQIKSSTPGKRRWRLRDEIWDYSITERSTFPDWSKFFYEQTPKNYKHRYNSNFVAYEHGFFNGNTREILDILNKLLHGQIYTSKRRYEAIDIMIKGMLDYIKGFEYENQCSFFYNLNDKLM